MCKTAVCVCGGGGGGGGWGGEKLVELAGYRECNFRLQNVVCYNYITHIKFHDLVQLCLISLS